jgi:hypothetical protein
MINEKEYDIKVRQIEKLYDLSLARELTSNEKSTLTRLTKEVDLYYDTFFRPNPQNQPVEDNDLPLLNLSLFPLDTECD